MQEKRSYIINSHYEVNGEEIKMWAWGELFLVVVGWGEVYEVSTFSKIRKMKKLCIDRVRS